MFRIVSLPVTYCEDLQTIFDWEGCCANTMEVNCVKPAYVYFNYRLMLRSL